MHVRQRLGASERRACKVLGQARSTQRRKGKVKDDEEALREDVVGLAGRFGRYGYRMITGMLKAEGWRVNHKRVKRMQDPSFSQIRPRLGVTCLKGGQAGPQIPCTPKGPWITY